MGNEKSQFFYSKKISPDSETETGVFRNPCNCDSQELTHSVNPYILTLQDAFLETTKNQNGKAFLGTRNEDGLYAFKSYQEVFEIAQRLGSSLLNQGFVPEISEFENYKLRFVGIFSKNREEYLECEIACMLYGLTSVAFYDTLGLESLEFILKQTNLITMMVSRETMEVLMNLKYLGKLQYVICFDSFNDMNLEFFEKKSIKVYLFSDFLKKGSESILNPVKINPETLLTFSYTSGTTGQPKGVMLSHKNFISVIAGLKQVVTLKPEDVHLSYLPMAHVFEKIIQSLCIYEGVGIGFYSGDVLKLKDDLQALHPTIFASVPRLFNKFHEVMKMKLDKLVGWKASFSKKAVESKLNGLKSKGSLTHSFYDRMVFKKIKQAFGGKVRLLATGSAPISGDVVDFMKICNSCPFVQGYGQTESTGVSFLTFLGDSESDHTGGPLINTEFKLRNVPEMNYYVNKGVDGPIMGEILLRGPGVFAGYYKDKEKTREVIDEHGWLHTGDIGLLLKNGGVRIMDRIKNIFKLAQGEFVAAEKVENVYEKSKFVSEIFVYGDAFESFIVGIVVPERTQLMKLGESLKIKGNFVDLCGEKEIKEAVLKELEVIGKTNGLKGFEIVKRIYLESDSFAKKDLVTSTFKLKRFMAREIYAKEIKEMYSN